MEWIKAKERPPTKEDSPILTWRKPICEGQEDDDGCLLCAALHWLDGWDGEGWYDHSDEYGMRLEDMEYWIHLPKRPHF